jgi:glycosyltransferase involved in cell wall biosynthesis
MKIAINGRFLLKPFTGIGQVTKNLFGELAKIESKNEYVFVVPSEIKGNFPKNVKIEVLPEKKMPAGVRKTWWEQVSFQEFVRKGDFQMVIFPYPANPWTSDFYKKGVKTVVMVHDCIPWKNRGYRRGLLSKMYQAQSRRAVKKADLVLTVSEYSKKDIVRLCGVDAAKVKVVYNDADEVYKKGVSDKEVSRVLAERGLKKGGYFLYCGGYDERKNVAFFVNEYVRFTEQSGRDIPLVLGGGKLFESRLYGSFDKKVRGVMRTGFLKASELAALYTGCLAFVHLSKEEGFNIPIIEAGACGAPLILSDIEVHREITGDEALYVDISREGDGAQKMEKVLEAGVREGLVASAREVAGRYSWERSAAEVRVLLDEIA